jgi:hypothetical protein
MQQGMIYFLLHDNHRWWHLFFLYGLLKVNNIHSCWSYHHQEPQSSHRTAWKCKMMFKVLFHEQDILHRKLVLRVLPVISPEMYVCILHDNALLLFALETHLSVELWCSHAPSHIMWFLPLSADKGWCRAGPSGIRWTRVCLMTSRNV